MGAEAADPIFSYGIIYLNYIILCAVVYMWFLFFILVTFQRAMFLRNVIPCTLCFMRVTRLNAPRAPYKPICTAAAVMEYNIIYYTAAVRVRSRRRKRPARVIFNLSIRES
jgi:hypothetical protein